MASSLWVSYSPKLKPKVTREPVIEPHPFETRAILYAYAGQFTVRPGSSQPSLCLAFVVRPRPWPLS